MEDEKRNLKAVFGESSESEEEEVQSIDSIMGKTTCSWERVSEIKGLWLCKNFLSLEQQSVILSAIEQEGWFTEASHNQAMRFGDLPHWAIELSGFIREAVCSGEFFSQSFGGSATHDQGKEDACPLPSDLLWREPLFDQLIVNVYEPGEGICGHVDLMRFEDGIAIVSLESACVMHFTPVKRDASCSADNGEANESSPTTKVTVFLAPGSLVLMSREARYLWKHEINRKPRFQMWEGEEIHQEKRTSVTLRKLCKPE